MAEYQTIRGAAAGVRTAEIDAGLRAHMNKVYGTMSVGMIITALASWAIAGLAVTSDPSATGIMLREGEFLSGLGAAIYTSPLRWVVMLAPLAFIFFGWGAVLSRASAGVAQVAFYGFAALIGISLSSIFLIYTDFSIVQTFLVTAIAFAGLSLYGYTTKRDMSGMRTFLVMGLIGLIIAMVVNIFLASSAMAFAISVIGVLLFAGLTAYDTQHIKNEYLQHVHMGDADWLDKSAIHGSLMLYLDFINMFQFLLYFMGNQE